MFEYDKNAKKITNTETGSSATLKNYAFEDKIAYEYYTYVSSTETIDFTVDIDHGHHYAKALAEKEMGGHVTAGQLKQFLARCSEILAQETPLHFTVSEISDVHMPLSLETAMDLMALVIEFHAAHYEAPLWLTAGLKNKDPRADRHHVAPFLLMDRYAGFSEKLNGKWF